MSKIYIKDLSPELQEKARACKTTDELLSLAKKHNVPLPDKALEAVAGGTRKSTDQCPKRGNGLPHDCTVVKKPSTGNE